jgi:hypothetical protein
MTTRLLSWLSALVIAAAFFLLPHLGSGAVADAVRNGVQQVLLVGTVTYLMTRLWLWWRP